MWLEFALVSSWCNNQSKGFFFCFFNYLKFGSTKESALDNWNRHSSILLDRHDFQTLLGVCICEILARYHAPGAEWYWNPHTAAINIPIYFLTYIFSHYCKKHIKIFFKNGGQQRDSNHRPIDHEPSRITSTPARVLCRNIAFYPAWTFTE